MSDLRPMWEAICRDLGINARLVDVHFLFRKEARYEYGVSGLGAVFYGDSGKLPEVVVAFPYKVGNNGFDLDWVELKNTCYHELIHLLLRDEVQEEDVEKMSDIINRRQKGWRLWCAYLREKAIALGLGPPDEAHACAEKERRRKLPAVQPASCEKYS